MNFMCLQNRFLSPTVVGLRHYYLSSGFPRKIISIFSSQVRRNGNILEWGCQSSLDIIVCSLWRLQRRTKDICRKLLCSNINIIPISIGVWLDLIGKIFPIRIFLFLREDLKNCICPSSIGSSKGLIAFGGISAISKIRSEPGLFLGSFLYLHFIMLGFLLKYPVCGHSAEQLYGWQPYRQRSRETWTF